jgi:hypothetical protein
MYNQMKFEAKEMFGAFQPSMTRNELIIIDNLSWVLIHAYIFKDGIQLSILISLECVTQGRNANNLTKVIMDVLQNEGGLFKFNIALKLLSFEIDGENILSELIPFYFFNFLFP